MVEILFDDIEKKYYFTKDNKREYLKIGDRVSIRYHNRKVEGEIGYSNLIKNGYFLLFGNDFISFSMVKELDNADKIK